MANTTNKDIGNKVNDLERKVDSLAQRQDEVLIPGMLDIKEQLQNLAYVSQKDYANDKEAESIANTARDKRIAELEKMVYAGSLKIWNAVFGKAFGYIVTALAVVVIVGTIFGLASTLPAVQSALGNVQNEKNN